MRKCFVILSRAGGMKITGSRTGMGVLCISIPTLVVVVVIDTVVIPVHTIKRHINSQCMYEYTQVRIVKTARSMPYARVKRAQ